MPAQNAHGEAGRRDRLVNLPYSAALKVSRQWLAPAQPLAA